MNWDACYNARDLGGYVTADGRRTRWRAFVRADNLSRLTPDGQSALIEYGVRTMIDLRRAVPETMLGVLTYLDQWHGGAARYLRAAGVVEADLERLRQRIREDYRL
ncbi:MAG: tyrosine-protein phosphatase [Roseiflexaceae bacterium]